MKTRSSCDVIVIGAGHAGCEAALAAARIGARTLLFSMNRENIAQMSCNPAIGGIAKGHLVREIDALGGQMARTIDETGIQFRMLNTSKGPAVRALRAQADRVRYRLSMQATLETQPNLTIVPEQVDRIVAGDERVEGVVTKEGTLYRAKAVIVTTGTFLRGLIHVGLTNFSAGRAGEPAADGLSSSLEAFGFRLGRLKTGTPPRLDGRTIDFSVTTPQHGDDPPRSFSYRTERITQPQVPCFLTYTSAETHRIIADNLDRSPLFTGVIQGIGPRYCPSIEDKIHRFGDKERHQVFLEPDGLDTPIYYPNGISTSLPVDIQHRFVRTIPGLERVEFIKPGYAIEYDFVLPTQLRPTLETKHVPGLYHAGQINGTSGYEEAAAQGIMAGINAALTLTGREPVVLDRSEAYIGVLIDDLVTKGTNEPYRMFTSRAEYRLLLRHDNADLRLMDIGARIGLLDADTYRQFRARRVAIEAATDRLRSLRVSNQTAEAPWPGVLPDTTLAQLLKRPEVTFADLAAWPEVAAIDPEIAEQVEIEIKYEGYITRQRQQVGRVKHLEEKKIPEDFCYERVVGLSHEVVEKLAAVAPRSLGQASRISGVTPAALSLLLVALERDRRGASGAVANPPVPPSDRTPPTPPLSKGGTGGVSESPSALLARGAAELGVSLAPAQLDQFSQYLTELDVWNRRMNLTGTRDPREIVTHHVLDSLAGDVVLRDLPDAAEVADLGSGAGFPGVPLAIARPALRFTLIEPRGKRAAFLLHVCGVLGLTRVTVVDRAIDPRDPGVYVGRFARVLARAVADPVEAIRTARPLLGADGQVVVWVSDKQAAEAPEEFRRIPYRLPGTAIARVLLVACP